MIKIRALRPNDLRQVLLLLKRYSEQEFEYTVLQTMRQLYIPMHQISQLLPLRMQFLPAIFVAASRGQVLGLIWLSRDGAHPRRWKIDQLILDPESFSYDVGTQLINYVINRYGGEGVQTFLAYVDLGYTTGLELLKSCGFRQVTRQHYFMHDKPVELAERLPVMAGFRESGNADAVKLRDLYNDCLTPEARVSLEKSWQDFYRPLPQMLSAHLKGLFFKRWVLDDVARDVLVASVSVSTSDFREFYLSVLVHPAYEERFEDVLGFALKQVLRNTANAIVYADFPEFGKRAIDICEKEGFSRISTAAVLVKDYWIPIQDQGNKLRSPILLFSGRTSPAVNCR